jgi:hypothetical protein
MPHTCTCHHMLICRAACAARQLAQSKDVADGAMQPVTPPDDTLLKCVTAAAAHLPHLGVAAPLIGSLAADTSAAVVAPADSVEASGAAAATTAMDGKATAAAAAAAGDADGGAGERLLDAAASLVQVVPDVWALSAKDAAAKRYACFRSLCRQRGSKCALRCYCCCFCSVCSQFESLLRRSKRRTAHAVYVYVCVCTSVCMGVFCAILLWSVLCCFNSPNHWLRSFLATGAVPHRLHRCLARRRHQTVARCSMRQLWHVATDSVCSRRWSRLCSSSCLEMRQQERRQLQQQL